MSATAAPTPIAPAQPTKLPLGALLVMAMTGFIVIMTETMPAGLLPQLAAGLGVSEGAAGQLVGVYAIGTTIAVIPAIGLTRGLNRKLLLLAGLIGFVLANTVTALVPIYSVTLVARFVAGAFAGLLWGMLATYARGISPSKLAGRALSIALTGTPLALALGTPAGTWLGTNTHWQVAFLTMTGVTVLVLLAAVAIVPDLAGQPKENRANLLAVVRIPGVALILVAVLTWLLAHNLLYTYIAPFLSNTTLGLRPDIALLIFGLASLIGIWLTGLLIDRALRRLALLGSAAMIVAGVVLALSAGSLVLTVVAIALWGIAFGGAATQLQTAMSVAAGANADMAIALLTAVFNLAIFAAAASGAVLVETGNSAGLPIAMAVVSAVTLVTVLLGRISAFPRGRD